MITDEELDLKPPKPQMTVKQLRHHASVESLCMSIDRRVYDVTKFVYEHPGGELVMWRKAGRDASDEFV